MFVTFRGVGAKSKKLGGHETSIRDYVLRAARFFIRACPDFIGSHFFTKDVIRSSPMHQFHAPNRTCPSAKSRVSEREIARVTPVRSDIVLWVVLMSIWELQGKKAAEGFRRS
jgi:hypothetical protein